IENKSVGAGDVVQEAIDLAPGAHTKHPARRIVQSGQPLIRKIQVTVRREYEIVDGLQPLEAHALKKRRDRARIGVQHQDALFVIGDEYPAIAVNLEPVRLAVVLRDQRESALGVYPENTAPRNVDAVEIALAVERRAFEQGMSWQGARLMFEPLRSRLFLAQ